MATADDVLRIAAAEIGYSRWDDPEPGTKYGRWYAQKTGESYYGQSGVPYCAMYTSFVFDQSNVECAGLPGAYCPAMLAEAEAQGRTVPVAQAQPGDVVYFDWGGDGESDHVGIVVANHGTYLETIEGNTSAGSAGSQSNGGVVARRTRAFGTVCGVVRPNWSDESTPAPVDGKLEVDGVIGKASVTKWQKQVGVKETGVVSGQLEECKGSYPALTSVTYEGTGSELMLAVQRILGVPNPTGVAASGTMAMLQGWLYLHGYSCAEDKAGVLGTATAKALQQSLNEGAWE